MRGRLFVCGSGIISCELFGAYHSVSLYDEFARFITGMRNPYPANVADALGGPDIENSIYSALCTSDNTLRRRIRSDEAINRQFWRRCRLARRLILRDLGLTESKLSI